MYVLIVTKLMYVLTVTKLCIFIFAVVEAGEPVEDAFKRMYRTHHIHVCANCYKTVYFYIRSGWGRRARRGCFQTYGPVQLNSMHEQTETNGIFQIQTCTLSNVWICSIKWNFHLRVCIQALMLSNIWTCSIHRYAQANGNKRDLSDANVCAFKCMNLFNF